MKRILLLCIALLCIVPFASAGTVTCSPPAAAYNETMWITCSYTPYDLGGDVANNSMRFYYMKGGRFGTVAKDVSNPDSYLPFEGGATTGFFFPPGTNFTPANIVMTYGSTGNPNGCSQTINNPLIRDGGSCLWAGYYESGEFTFNYSTPQNPTANFTASATNATAPAYISFTDTSQNETGTCTYNWSFSPSDGVLAAPGDLDNEDITMLFTENGDFTITHWVTCDGASDSETKADYIHITNSTALSTFRVRAVDAISGYGINGAQVNVLDVENSSWINQTSSTGEVTVTALTGHTINAYGSATGYDDGESLGLPVVASSLYPIYMWPSTMTTNVSEGNVTVYVTLLEEGTNTRLSGYSLSLTGPATGGASFTSGVTNENGIFQATISNKTNYRVEVHPQKGHLGGNKNFYSGNESGGDSYVEVTLWLGVNAVTTSPTATTLPGGGTPTPTVTYLENCDPDASDYDAAKCRSSKGGMGLNILADNMESLIWLCLIVTVIYLFKGIGR